MNTLAVNNTFYKQLAYEQYLKCFEDKSMNTSNHINHVCHHHTRKVNLANNLCYEPIIQGA